ncbi:MAG: WXG100 family type VII secretion target [Chloroflexi bacterium]|nr:WXG100 family type VII secretion target [Chloroflexota bacterium]
MSSMMALVLVNYEMMKKFQNSFKGQEAATQQSIQKITKVVEEIRGGEWIGEGATKFLSDMDSTYFPAMKRLQNAMTEGDRVTKEIEKIQHDTESQITSLFKDILSKFAEA